MGSVVKEIIRRVRAVFNVHERAVLDACDETRANDVPLNASVVDHTLSQTQLNESARRLHFDHRGRPRNDHSAHDVVVIVNNASDCNHLGENAC